MDMPEIEEMITQQLEKQREIGMEFGYVIGEREGFEKGSRAAICELLYSRALPEQEIKKIFKLDDAAIEEMRETISSTRWLIAHIDE